MHVSGQSHTTGPAHRHPAPSAVTLPTAGVKAVATIATARTVGAGAGAGAGAGPPATTVVPAQKAQASRIGF